MNSLIRRIFPTSGSKQIQCYYFIINFKHIKNFLKQFFIEENMSHDIRKYTSQTNIRLIVGAFILLFVVGLGLIAIIYGIDAALVGLLCLLGALIPIGLVALLMFGLDIFVKKINK
jgi:hypothetical protein